MRAIEGSISVIEAAPNLEAIVQRVAKDKDEVILKIAGEPKAVVVPIEAYRIYKKWRREEFFNWIEEVSARADVSEEEAEELIQEAIVAVRAEERERRKSAT